MSTKDTKASPVLKEFTFSYLQKNLSPLIQEITLHPAGDFYPEAANNRSNNSHLGNGQSSASNGSSSQSPGRKTFRKGYRTVSWKSLDENGDQLSYDLFYMGVDEVSWKTLVEDFHGRVYSWDSELFPDGRYVIKVVARDDLSNPPGMSLSAEKTSQPFKVDNSGPEVSNIAVKLSGDEAAISFAVSDKMTNITSVEYGINAQEWRLVYPVDGICDSKNERFKLNSRSYIEGENIVVIKAKDALGNLGFGKAKIKL
ncbi:hypothetical protein MJD09_10620 [bacterium]|nr:hypothetical protein [bacterium]